MNIYSWVRQNSKTSPDKPAIVFDNDCLSYLQFCQRIDYLSSYLIQHCKLKKGDRIIWLGLNHPDALALLFACAKLGMIFLPLNWRLALPEHEYIITNSGAAVLFTDGEFEERVCELSMLLPSIDYIRTNSLTSTKEFDAFVGTDLNAYIAKAEDLPLLLVYTSGTTGRPKGAILTHTALLTNALMSIDMHDMHNNDRVLGVLPIFHVGGLNIQVTPAIFIGACVVLRRRYEPNDFLVSMKRYHPSLVVMVPATIQALLASKSLQDDSLSSLRCMTTGSSIVPRHLITAVERLGVPVIQVYGSTETCPIAVYQRFKDVSRNPAATGHIGKYCELRIVDNDMNILESGMSGEILIRGANVMQGYWQDEIFTQKSFHDGWFRTGDIGKMLLDGNLIIIDRSKDMIISGGENIYPAEIERILYSLPEVAEVAVVGKPSKKWGEIPVAFVRCFSDLTIQQLAQQCGSELARFKQPKEFILVTDFPRNSLGKIQKFILRRQFMDG